MLKSVRAFQRPFGGLKREAPVSMTATEILSRLPKHASSKPRDIAGRDLTFDDRKAHRFTPLRTSVMLTTMDGKKFSGRIINVSSLAVAIEADFRRIDPHLVRLVGQEPVKPGRRVAIGHVFVFDKPLRPERCRQDLVL